MRTLLLLLLINLIAINLLSQDMQAKADYNLFASTGTKKWFSIKDNVTFETSKAHISTFEIEIAELESREMKAVVKRDTLILSRIWARDFTLDEPLPELVSGKNSIPYYISLTRLICNLYQSDNTVFTSGYEMSQRLDAMGKIESPTKKYFFHTWTKLDGTWKMSTKTTGE